LKPRFADVWSVARPIPTIIAVATRETQESDLRVASWFMVSAGWIEAVKGQARKSGKISEVVCRTVNAAPRSAVRKLFGI
jgi:hypothetical protein